MQQSSRRGKSFYRKRDEDRPIDISRQGEFMFNKASILSSALHRLKSQSPKPAKREAAESLSVLQPHKGKKIKPNLQDQVPIIEYTPLQKNWYNFFVVNKATLKSLEIIPEPKLEMGSAILCAISDRGVGGKYLVGNLFRNKKVYIDYSELQVSKGNEQRAKQAMEKYDHPGDYVVGTITKARNATHLQLSLSEFGGINEKEFRIGQTFPAEVKSKEELGCHLVAGSIKYKIFLQKSAVTEAAYEALQESKQIIVVITQTEEAKRLLKVSLANESEIVLNLRDVDEGEMSKLELEQYLCPGTLINTKIVKVLQNGVLVKFLKVFTGFIHADHLNNRLSAYVVDEKILARVIFRCANPPAIYLSQRHVLLTPYSPSHQLYSQVQKPQQLQQIQGSYLNKQQQFFVHPIQLHSDIGNVKRFWVKEINYFQRYMIMSSWKLGLRVGEVAKQVPFSNFRVYPEGEGKFRVMCIDLWNKVIKVTRQKVLLHHQHLLMSRTEINPAIKYCGFIANVSPNGTVVQFCNNIRGILSKKELQINGISLTQANIGQTMQVYVTLTNKTYLKLSLSRQSADKPKTAHSKTEESAAENTSGVIMSVNVGSIHPIYVKIKHKLVKIDAFSGIVPASLEALPVLQNIPEHFEVNKRVPLYKKKKGYSLYPPEQLCDPELRICRIVSRQGCSLRVQISCDEFRNCHICDVSDIISPYPLADFNVGSYAIGRIIDDKYICLRKTIVVNGFPKNMQECKKNETLGDYRARIDTFGGASLKVDMLVFGYVKACTEKGCFISIARNFDVRVQTNELSDVPIHDKALHFRTNKLVLLRLIGSKDKKEGDIVKKMFDASLRASVVKYGYPLNDEILKNGVGLTVIGTVVGYTKGRGLIRLNSSRFTGIINQEDTGSNSQESIEKTLPLGTVVTCKIIQYSLQGDKRLIQLSTLARYFKKYEGFQCNFDVNQQTIKLIQNYQKLKQIEPPIAEEPVNASEADQEDQYQRLKRILAQENYQGIQQEEQIQENKMEQEVSCQEKSVQRDEDGDKEENEDEGHVQAQNGNQNNLKQQSGDTSMLHLDKFEQMPHSSSFYQSLILANPTPESYLMYISSLLGSSTPDHIRGEFQRAINSLLEIKDKDNMWISWLNAELILGDLIGTVDRAIKAGAGIPVYCRILQILVKEEKWDVAIKFGKKMLSKFNKEPKAYTTFLRCIAQYSISHDVPAPLSLKQTLRRAKQCLLSSAEIIQIEAQYGKNLFELKQIERARNLFQDILKRHPNRTDLWTVYTDYEVKYGEVDKARNVLETALTSCTKKKSVIALLKKYYLLQQTHGTAQSAQAILDRAHTLAESFEQQEVDDDSVEDIE